MPQSCLPASITEDGEDHGQKMPVENTISPELMSFLEKLECKPDEELNLSYEDQQSLDKHLQELDCVCNVLRQAKNKIREQDRKKTADEIRGDFDNPLDKVFNDLKPFFVLDEDSFKNLACVSKGMRQVLKDVRVSVTKERYTSWKIKTVRLGLPICYEKLCPKLMQFEFKHIGKLDHAERRKTVDVVLGNRLIELKNLESFSFTTWKRLAHDLKFKDFKCFTALRSFTIETRRLSFMSWNDDQEEGLENRLWFPQDLNMHFPVLKILHLVHVRCTEDCSVLHLSRNLEVIHLEMVTGLSELRSIDTHSVSELTLLNVPDLAISALPSTLEKLGVSAIILMQQVDRLPDSLNSLKIDATDIYADDYDAKKITNLRDIYEKFDLHSLKSVKFINIGGQTIHSLPILPSIFCQSNFRATKVIVGSGISSVTLYDYYELQEISIADGVEHVVLSYIPNLEVLVLPASCRSVALRGCYTMSTLVFKGCALERIVLFDMEDLAEVRIEDGAEVPQDILQCVQEYEHYPSKKDMPKSFLEFLDSEIEGSISIKWTDELGNDYK